MRLGVLGQQRRSRKLLTLLLSFGSRIRLCWVVLLEKGPVLLLNTDQTVVFLKLKKSYDWAVNNKGWLVWGGV